MDLPDQITKSDLIELTVSTSLNTTRLETKQNNLGYGETSWSLERYHMNISMTGIFINDGDMPPHDILPETFI